MFEGSEGQPVYRKDKYDSNYGERNRKTFCFLSRHRTGYPYLKQLLQSRCLDIVQVTRGEYLDYAIQYIPIKTNSNFTGSHTRVANDQSRIG